MKALGTGRKITSLLLCASLAGVMFTGCKKGDDMFPSIIPAEGREDISEVTEETSETEPLSDIEQLTVALPYSDLTVQCLASMYYSKNNGLWDSSDTGLTVDTDYLSSMATNYVPLPIRTSAGFLVIGLSGKIRIQLCPSRCM